MTDAWPWLFLIGLGALHGLNPAMGWLFAVALGLHRNSLTVVLMSLLPIALAWLLDRSPATLPIPGTLSIEHARENLAALEIELTDEERAALG